MKKILLLGASGSIGQNVLQVLKENRDIYELVGFSIYQNYKTLEIILENFPKVKYIGLIKSDQLLKEKFPNIIFFDGPEFLKELINAVNYDLMVNALVGFSGVIPTILSINKGKNIALANKESLVVAGDIIKKRCLENNVKIIPIDSEHSAIMQCIGKYPIEDVKKIYLTCSGGSLRDIDDDNLNTVSVNRVLQHPNWKMGNKITIDSATLVNKSFEVIEAHYLFNLPLEKIKVIQHNQSIVHSLVEFKDGTVLGQFGDKDMKNPIRTALSYPERLPFETNFDLYNIGKLEFNHIKPSRYKMIELGYKVIKEKGTYGTVFNAANDILVEYFLQGRIHFSKIIDILSMVMENHNNNLNPTIDDIIICDLKTREKVLQLIEEEK